MVEIITNRPEFLNDLSEIVRLYVGFVEIQEGADFNSTSACALDVQLEAGIVKARAKKQSRIVSYEGLVQAHEQSALIKKRYEKRAMKIAAFRVMRLLEPEVLLPWGSLTGIRPTKLLRELIETLGEQAALESFSKDFDVLPEKINLAHTIINEQRPIINSIGERDVDVYVGIPFCASRCLYCSFASEVVGRQGVPQAYIDALHLDVELGASIAEEGAFNVRSVYIGGGTPTVLTTKQLHALILHIQKQYKLGQVEFSVEAGRPDTVDEEKLRMLRDCGIGRISLNPQTMNAQTLKRIGRAHTPEDIEQAYFMARNIGFESINMDVIVGLPGETLEDVQSTLTRIAALEPDNLTVHTLAVKRSSLLKDKLEEHPLPGAQAAQEMVNLAGSVAKELNMQPYYMYRQKYMQGNLENVGYTKPGKVCIYNIDMMEELTSILAHGAGAMTKRVFNGRDQRVERIPAPKDIKTYITKLGKLNEQKRKLFLE